MIKRLSILKSELPNCFGHPRSGSWACRQCLVFGSCVSAKGTPDETTAEVEFLRQIKEAKEHLVGKSTEYRLGFIQGAKFVVSCFARRYDRPADGVQAPK